MNHAGEITPLVKMARPHVAIITNVAAVHLGAFKNVSEIAYAKSEIFDGMEPDGSVVLNAGDKYLPILEARAGELGIKNIVRFGEGENAQSHLDKLVLHGHCSCLTATILDEEMVVKVGAPGRHMAGNVLAVLAAVKLVDGDLAKAGLALAELKAVKGRGQQHRLSFGEERVILIDESYNANPTSMRAALELLGATNIKNRGRRIAVLGDMLEMGPTSSKLHAELAEAVVDNKIDLALVAGPDMQALNKALNGKVECVHGENAEALTPLLMAELRPGDAVMVKASLGMKFAEIVDDLLAKYLLNG
jgi:UDP-N-acetylmuramoyl-tripeptide--D-alanyl-D-alanine ligase